MEYLGHWISAAGVKADPKKIKIILEWPLPTNVKETQLFRNDELLSSICPKVWVDCSTATLDDQWQGVRVDREVTRGI